MAADEFIRQVNKMLLPGAFEAERADRIIEKAKKKKEKDADEAYGK